MLVKPPDDGNKPIHIMMVTIFMGLLIFLIYASLNKKDGDIGSGKIESQEESSQQINGCNHQ